MNKRSYFSFVSLFLFWIIVSGSMDIQHIVVGILLAGLTVWFWKDFDAKLPNVMSFKEILLFGRLVLMLIVYVIKSNIEVAKILLFSKGPITPMFLEMELGVNSDWGRVFLATCITITPGTITIDFDPDHNIFTVHALTRDMGISLYHWSMISEIHDLERIIQRRERNAVNTGRVHDSNTISTTESSNRTNRD